MDRGGPRNSQRTHSQSGCNNEPEQPAVEHLDVPAEASPTPSRLAGPCQRRPPIPCKLSGATPTAAGAKLHNPLQQLLGILILGDSMLPKLKQLSIKGPSGMSYVHLALLVGSRWRHPLGDFVRIESVEVNYSGPCTHAKSSMTQIPAHTESRESGWALALLRQYRSEGLRVVGPPVDEDECIECIEEHGHHTFQTRVFYRR
ncbi:hypothetical protein FIBSPDRAFT_1007850 [Athelia psychrophila]|uniref:Uncharacterized protein n=1 Tax=Athelia psychrophila TaxID=1759441 RepID=A0A166P345_9AGAM|nr:hypothetical protein FIBSPDRAFT_1007850 [Fibularhizoctonia sp. CBS 109695]